MSDSPRDERDPRADDDAAQSAVERWVMPYFEEPGLWPVLVVVLAALAAFMTPVLLRAVRDLDLRAILATLLLVFGTVRAAAWEWRLRGRPGALSGALAAVWALAIAASYFGGRAGFV